MAEGKKELTEKTYYVYGLFKEIDLVYIGFTGHVKRRMYTHKKNKDCNGYLILFEGDKNDCVKVELMLIKLFKIYVNPDILNCIPQYGKESLITPI